MVKLLSKAYNQTRKLTNSFAHAEILALQQASKIKKKSSCLNDCDLYVTLEPCLMLYAIFGQK